LRINDRLRPGALELIGKLTCLEPVLLSGDRANAVADLAARAGIRTWQAEVTPEGKVATVQSIGGRALMIGDGLNDAPAMAAAHVSASPSGAADITRNAADLVLVGDRLDSLAPVLDIAKDAKRLIAQNLQFSALYNIVTVPLALAGGLTPLIAAILMSSSSILVMLNALRLRVRP
ncbi:MAG: HAD-IC family P-type ATPase, partial [Pseudomonadota bacterium]